MADRPRDRGNIAKGSHCEFYVFGMEKKSVDSWASTLIFCQLLQAVEMEFLDRNSKGMMARSRDMISCFLCMLQETR